MTFTKTYQLCENSAVIYNLYKPQWLWNHISTFHLSHEHNGRTFLPVITFTHIKRKCVIKVVVGGYVRYEFLFFTLARSSWQITEQLDLTGHSNNNLSKDLSLRNVPSHSEWKYFHYIAWHIVLSLKQSPTFSHIHFWVYLLCLLDTAL